MSLAAESPLHSSSSSDDFAAILSAELELASSDTSPDDDDDDVDVDVDEADNEENDYAEHRSKRPKLEDLESTEELHESIMVGSIQERTVLQVVEMHEPHTDDDICPPHPGFFKGMCMRCGQLEEEDGSGVAFSYIHKDLRLDTREIDRLRGADLKNLLRDRKLILILDLDHTLLNSTRLVDITSEEDHLLREAEFMKDDPNRTLFKLGNMHLLTKLRPFVRTFLEEASQIFEMYVYTMAERSYALEIAKILDPGKVYFNSKVISQSDCTQRHQKGLDVVLGAESVVLILDDTESVWHKHKRNLILMERYHYFASSCRQFGFDAKSLSELKKDERESDGALANILNVLKRAHKMFFDPNLGTDLSSRDVRQVIGTIRQETLQGCKIVFSRVFRTNSVAEDQSIWKMAKQLGAVCLEEVDSSVTHVVSTDAGTQKARWAVKNDKFLVNPGWIEAANYLWRRQREDDFLISAPKKA